jgi:hypothetical protein
MDRLLDRIDGALDGADVDLDHLALDAPKRPWRFFEKVEWSGTSPSSPSSAPLHISIIAAANLKQEIEIVSVLPDL